jgi:hypothetical protein
MILMRANPLRGSLEGVGPENQYFLHPEMAMSEASVLWAKKVEINIIKSECHIKNRYVGNFMIMSFCILYCML